MTLLQIRVEVEAADIEAGLRADSTACPIAIAVRRAIDVSDETAVGVGENHVWVFEDAGVRLAEAAIFDLPAAAADFVARFDAGEQPPPLVFLAPRRDPAAPPVFGPSE